MRVAAMFPFLIVYNYDNYAIHESIQNRKIDTDLWSVRRSASFFLLNIGNSFSEMKYGYNHLKIIKKLSNDALPVTKSNIGVIFTTVVKGRAKWPVKKACGSLASKSIITFALTDVSKIMMPWKFS